MDGATNGRKRQNGTGRAELPDSTPERKRCKFCKGLFPPNPNQARHDFCRDECRKNFHKYGALPLVKLRQDFAKRVDALGSRLDRDMLRLREQASILEGALKTTGALMRELNHRIDALEAADVMQRAVERVLRGGGAAA